MNPTQEITALYQIGGTAVGSGGTVTASAIDFAGTYEPQAQMILAMGATPSGAVVATLQQSSDGTAYTTLGTISTSAGTALSSVNSGVITGRYVRTVVTSTGGTALCSAQVLAKKRTVT